MKFLDYGKIPEPQDRQGGPDHRAGGSARACSRTCAGHCGQVCGTAAGISCHVR
jgi:hypothetical protein